MKLPRQDSASFRLSELDALRGFAALAVVLYHFTDAYQRLFGHPTPPPFSLKIGDLPVYLFFVISGFVIDLTLQRCRTGGDFLISRFARLFPAYWAAVLLTAAVVWTLGLPGYEPSLKTVAINLTMLQEFLRTPHVDFVYWTLERELLFYLIMYLIFRFGVLAHAEWILVAMTLLRVATKGAYQLWGWEFSWTLTWLLNLNLIALFAIGVVLQRWKSDGRARIRIPLVAALWLAFGYVHGDWRTAAMLGVLLLIFIAAISGLMPWLKWRPLVFLGSISYTLYLTHQYAGYALMRQLHARGLSTETTLLVSLIVALLVATAMTRFVERPAMKAIRSRWNQRQADLVREAA